MPRTREAEMVDIIEQLTILLERLVEVLNLELDQMGRERTVVLTDSEPTFVQMIDIYSYLLFRK